MTIFRWPFEIAVEVVLMCRDYPADAAACAGFLALWAFAAWTAYNLDPKQGARIR